MALRVGELVAFILLVLLVLYLVVRWLLYLEAIGPTLFDLVRASANASRDLVTK